MNASITIGDTTIHQDDHGRYSLNDLHRASGGEDRHRPAEFLRIGPTQELIEELQKDHRYGPTHIAPVEAIRGGPRQGTYVVRELVYAYAMWISPAFHLKVIRAFDAMATGHVPPAPAFEIPKTYAAALRLAADLQEKVEKQEALLSAQAPKVAAHARFMDASGTMSLRDAIRVLGEAEKAFIAQLVEDEVLYRMHGSGRLRAYAHLEKTRLLQTPGRLLGTHRRSICPGACYPGGAGLAEPMLPRIRCWPSRERCCERIQME